MAQLANAVALVMCTEALEPGAMSPKLQPSTWLPTGPVIVQVPGPAYAGLMDQLTPDPAGRLSVRVTLRAVPVPAAPLLDTVTVKPMALPALTVSWSGVLRTETFGQSTVVDAEAVTLPAVWLVALAVAVLGYVAQLDAVVPLVTCTV